MKHNIPGILRLSFDDDSFACFEVNLGGEGLDRIDQRNVHFGLERIARLRT